MEIQRPDLLALIRSDQVSCLEFQLSTDNPLMHAEVLLQFHLAIIIPQAEAYKCTMNGMLICLAAALSLLYVCLFSVTTSFEDY
jgi:hypothetical protein